MTRFLLRRLMWFFITIWAVQSISFFLVRATPGGPYTADRRMPPHVEEAFKAKYKLDDPLYVQYVDYFYSLAQFDLGLCFKMHDFTVNEVIAAGFPVSASLGFMALMFALALGLAAGIVSAVYRGGFWDLSLMGAATLGMAVPNFVLASLMIVLFVFVWPLFPAAGWGGPMNLVLPALCLGAPYAAYISRLTRTGMLEVLSQDYIRTAYAKGLSTRAVVLRHAMKGAMLPVVSFLGPAVAGILTGSIVVERIFAIPGLGVHLVNAASQNDYTLLLGMVLVYTVLLYTMNTIVDLSYRFLDPRVELE